jgi:hypothetical protein
MATEQQKRLPAIHPGEVLEDLLREAGLTANALALALRVPANRIGGILHTQGAAGRAAGHYGGHGVAPGTLFWDFGADVAALAVQVRLGGGRGGAGGADCAGGAAAERGLRRAGRDFADNGATLGGGVAAGDGSADCQERGSCGRGEGYWGGVAEPGETGCAETGTMRAMRCMTSLSCWTFLRS